jgi:cardiolipin synthase C
MSDSRQKRLATVNPGCAASGPPLRRRFALSLFGFLLIAAGVTGCSSLPKSNPEWSVRHPVVTTNTTWARTLAPAEAAHPGWSGVQLLRYGQDALSARLALADTAERTLDMQYYIWKPDASGQLLAEQAVRAADRGVRVRLLLDDIGGSASDEVLLALDSHTNIEVRLFNPVANRSFRTLSLLFDFQRANRRMHNKSCTADGVVTIVGGRNVEERYYALGEEPHFADFDVIAAGPVAGDVSTMFDRYWFSPSSIPIRALACKRLSPEQRAEHFSRLADHVATIAHSPAYQDLATNVVGAAASRRDLSLVWGATTLVCDQPEKVTTSPTNTATHLLPVVRAVVDKTTNELVVVSPYFVPGPKGVAFFKSLRQRGVRVVILSNSLAATDVIAVHAGYRRYRKELLRAGVELWEIKPNTQIRGSTQEGQASTKSARKPSRSSLHAKAFIFDHQTLFVGSLNLDPRSAVLNTEMGLIIEIPELAGPRVDTLETQLRQQAYRLEFVPSRGVTKECGSIVWISEENGREVRHTHEPQTSFFRRLQVNILSLLPIESQL